MFNLQLFQTVIIIIQMLNVSSCLEIILSSSGDIRCFLSAGHFSTNNNADMIITSVVSFICDASNQVRKLNCDIYWVKAMLLKVSSKNDF